MWTLKEDHMKSFRNLNRLRCLTWRTLLSHVLSHQSVDHILNSRPTMSYQDIKTLPKMPQIPSNICGKFVENGQDKTIIYTRRPASKAPTVVSFKNYKKIPKNPEHMRKRKFFFMWMLSNVINLF